MPKHDELPQIGVPDSPVYPKLLHEAERARAETLIRSLQTLKRKLKSG